MPARTASRLRLISDATQSVPRWDSDFFVGIILQSLEDEPGALAKLDQAFLIAKSAQASARAGAIAGTALLIMGSSWGDLAPCSLWIPRARGTSLPEDDEVALALYLAGWLQQHLFDPQDADREIVADFTARLSRVLRPSVQRLPSDVVLLIAEALLQLLSQAGETAAFEDIITLCESALDSADKRMTSKHLFWRGNHRRILDMPVEAQRCFDQAQAGGEQTQWYWIRLQLLRASLRPVIESRDSGRIETLLEENRQLLRAERPMDWGDYHHLRGWDALLRQDGRNALSHYRQCIENYRAAALPLHQLGVMQGGEASALVQLGRADEAALLFAGVPTMANDRAHNVKLANVAFANAVFARQTQKSDYLDHLCSGFAAAAAFDLVQIFRSLPKHAAELCADALQIEIEPVFVRKMIAARHFAAPSDAGGAWPWPLRIYALGTFKLSIHGEPLEFTGKAQHKPLELLHLLASNDGQPLSVSSVMDALWPDSDNGGGRKAFDTTLARLKKLITSNEWITIIGGKLFLDSTQVWIDTMELSRLAIRIDALLLPSLGNAELQRLANSVLRLYRAPFLAQEPESAWLLEARQRNKNRFVRTIERLATEFERRDLANDAMRLFERGSEIEPIAESFYRRLMLAHERRGDRAEAMRVFRQCRDMLSLVLSVAPSRETRAIAERLQQAEP